MNIKLRKAVIGDSKLLYEWANDDMVRKMSFSSDPISWKEHEAWFKKKILESNTQIYIAIYDNEPVGQIRFDLVDGYSAEVDIHTKQSFRGKGIGTQIISLGCSDFLSNSSVNTLRAFIKFENTKSMRAFEKAGFKVVEKKLIKGRECFIMIKKRT